MKVFKNSGKGFGLILNGVTYDFPYDTEVKTKVDVLAVLGVHLEKFEDITPPETMWTYNGESKRIEVTPEEYAKRQEKKHYVKPKPVKKPKAKKYTEEKLYDMNKAEQLKELKKLKYDGPTLKNEKGRVDKILELSK